LSKVISLVASNNGISRFFKFAIVGAIGAVVDFGVLNLLVLVFDVPKEYANLVSVSCAILSNFTWNRLWTYPESRERPVHTQFGKFALVNLIGLIINQTIFVSTDALIFGQLFPPIWNSANQALDHNPLAYNAAKATAIIVVLFWNFFVNRKTTYKGI
jgi:putative flippase GtrA